jgi:hypothetical protein
VWSNDGKPEKPLPPPIYKAGPGLVELDMNHLPKVNLFERSDDFSSVAYFYLDRPVNGLAAIPSVDDRTKGL